MIRIKKGLDIPLGERPLHKIEDARAVSTVALVGRDYAGGKASLLVREGDRVKLGQAITRDKKYPAIIGTAAGSGVVAAIHRGPKRVLETIVIRLEGDEEETFASYADDKIEHLGADKVRQNLLASGLWPAFRTRPYSIFADPNARPFAIFVNAMDTRPLAPEPEVIINQAAADFRRGIVLISKLSAGKLYVCKAPGASLPIENRDNIEVATFSGPHPAGLVGTHIHFLAPVSASRTVWHIGYQDVITVGRLFSTGRLDVERVVSLAGPAVRHPRLIRTRMGASTNELVRDELRGDACRVVSGSVLAGHHAVGTMAYLGRYHNQISVLIEGGQRYLFGWLAPGRNIFSATHAFLSNLFPERPFRMTTAKNGSPRAMVPIGIHEQVMPLDILATPLLRALVVKDTDTAQALGCLELDEEDLALCSFVDPGKCDFGPILRQNLRQIMKEG